MLANRGFDCVGPRRNGDCQERLHYLLDFREYVIDILFGIAPLDPEGNGEHVLGFNFRDKRQQLYESGLLSQNGEDFPANRFDQFVLPSEIGSDFDNSRKHGDSRFFTESARQTPAFEMAASRAKSRIPLVWLLSDRKSAITVTLTM